MTSSIRSGLLKKQQKHQGNACSRRDDTGVATSFADSCTQLMTRTENKVPHPSIGCQHGLCPVLGPCTTACNAIAVVLLWILPGRIALRRYRATWVTILSESPHGISRTVMEQCKKGIEIKMVNGNSDSPITMPRLVQALDFETQNTTLPCNIYSIVPV